MVDRRLELRVPESSHAFVELVSRLQRSYPIAPGQQDRREQHPAHRGELQLSHRLFSLGETVRGLPTTLDHFLRDQPDFIDPGSLRVIDHARHFRTRQGPVPLRDPGARASPWGLCVAPPGARPCFFAAKTPTGPPPPARTLSITATTSPYLARASLLT